MSNRRGRKPASETDIKALIDQLELISKSEKMDFEKMHIVAQQLANRLNTLSKLQTINTVVSQVIAPSVVPSTPVAVAS